MNDPLRGIDFSERIKPLIQEAIQLDQRRCAQIEDLTRQCQGAIAALRAIAEQVRDDLAAIGGQ